MTSAAERLARLIAATGPISLATFMAEANGAYYAGRDPFGAEGDFITAPEISQMFGEMVGLWMAQFWMQAGKPDAAYVELGPGRGTLAADALRTAARFGFAPPAHFVETSPALIAAQRERVAQGHWHGDIAELPKDGPLIIIANEFFDALPIRQLIRTPEGWRERQVAFDEAQFLPVAGSHPMNAAVPDDLKEAAIGTLLESSPAAVATMELLAARVAEQGGALLTIDYGYSGPQHGDTFQAVHRHAFANPFDRPGEQDLTAHVDFASLAAAGARAGLQMIGPMTQAEFLTAHGIVERADRLMAASPEREDAIRSQLERLIGADAMGALFKVLIGWAPIPTAERNEER